MKKALLLVAALAILCSGCGSASGDTGEAESGKLNPDLVRAAMRTLPYDVKLKQVPGPAGNTASFKAKAHGPHDTTLEFSIGIGDPPHPLPVPGAGTKHVEWFEEMNFVFNDDDAIGRKFKTAAQWREVAHMATKVNESLCKAATGEPCPI
jgi:hypothetical protein